MSSPQVDNGEQELKHGIFNFVFALIQHKTAANGGDGVRATDETLQWLQDLIEGIKQNLTQIRQGTTSTDND